MSKKNPIRLTKRGKLVRDTAVFVLVLAAALWALDFTTPDACRVPVAQMSGECKRLLFP